MNKEERQRRKSGYIYMSQDNANKLYISKFLRQIEDQAKANMDFDKQEYDEKTGYYIYEIKFVKKIK